MLQMHVLLKELTFDINIPSDSLQNFFLLIVESKFVALVGMMLIVTWINFVKLYSHR